MRGLIFHILLLTLTVVSWAPAANAGEPLKPIEPEPDPDFPGDTTIFIPIKPPIEIDTIPTFVDPAKPPLPKPSGTYAVGNMPGSFDVSASGAAVYNVPIECPPGGGLSPEVSIVYNSQNAAYGIAGYGISLSGLSSVTRGTKTQFSNAGASGGITYGSDDHLFLDSKRLILRTGEPLTDGATYVPEGEPYTQVTVVGTYGDLGQPCSLEVKAPDGKIYTYGANADSRLTYVSGEGKCRIASWSLSSIEDVYGNRVEYYYTRNGLYAYPREIVYGLNSKNTRGITCKITFNYEPTAGATVFNIEGQRGIIDRRLSSIVTSCGGAVYRKYTFGYDSTTDGALTKTDRLISIQEENGDGEKLAPVILEWEPLPYTSIASRKIAVSTEMKFPYLEAIYKNFFAADLNGDGVSDIIRISPYDITSSGSGYRNTYAFVSQSRVDSIGQISYSTPVYFTLPPVSQTKDIIITMGGSSLLDFDGDGLNDLIISMSDRTNDVLAEKFYIIYGKDIGMGRVLRASITVPQHNNNKSPLFATFDMDNDGKDEVFAVERGEYEGVYKAVSVDYDKNPDNFIDYAFKLPKEPKKLFSGDFNGDGLTDIIIIHEAGYKIYYNLGGRSSEAKFDEAHTSTGISLKDCWRMEPGDIDGDGLIDFIYYINGNKCLFIARNNGDGTFTTSKTDALEIDNNDTDKDDSRFALKVYDIDGDGRSDAVIVKARYDGKKYKQTDVMWLYSDGSTLKLKRSSTKSRENDADESSIFIGDFNGDGIMELANYGSRLTSTSSDTEEGEINVYGHAEAMPGKGKVKSITDCMGNRTEIEYASGTSPLVYSAGAVSEYPVNTYTLPFCLVKSVTQTEGIAAPATTEFSYKDMRIHVSGAGALGFGEVSRHNLSTGEISTTTVTAWDRERWLPIESKTTVSTAGLTSTSVSKTAVKPVNGTYFAYESENSVTDIYGNTAVTTSRYDIGKGVLVEQTVTNDGQNMYKKTVYGGYQNYGGRWLPGTLVLSQKHSDDPEEYSTTARYTYDSFGNTTSTTANHGTPMALTTTATYDCWGNVTSSVTTGKDVPEITQYREYDSSGRFLVKTWQSPAAAVKTFSYDRWGNCLSENDITDASNILTVTHTYDGWGQTASSTDAEGTVSKVSRGWASGSGRKYYEFTETDGAPWVLTYYDGAGRETRRESFGVKSTFIGRITSYDSLGRVVNVESRNGRLKTSETTEYDSLGRVATVTLSSGSTTSYSYGNRTVKVTRDGRTSSTTTDAWGNTLSSTDAAGTVVSYSYGSNGLPKSITTAGATVTMEYDVAGHRTSLCDPDAGATTYEYSADGRVLRQTDARGIVTATEYDALGRVSKMQIGDNTVTNTYGTAGYENLLLVKTEMGGNSAEYTHDRLGRVITEKRTVGNEGTYIFTQNYGKNGRIEKTGYPGGIEAVHLYDDYGFGTGTVVGSDTIVALRSHNGVHSETSFCSDSITYHISRDSNGFETSRHLYSSEEVGIGTIIKPGLLNYTSSDNVIVAGPAKVTLDRIEFSFDPLTANLLYRTRNRIKETFTYDNLDRLTSVSSGKSIGNIDFSSKCIMEMDYSAGGNIEYKTGLGDYSYSSVKPHAVTSVANEDAIIPSAALHTLFNAFNKIESIEDESTGLAMDFSYGPDLQRWHSSIGRNGADSISTVYAGAYEKITTGGTVREYYYLDGGIIIVREDGVATPYQTLTDYQGSILSAFDKEHHKVFEASYDPWGRQTVTVNEIGLRRGYTGHEMLNEFGIINMNGRLYDPMLGRFLSPDNYVQLPNDSQSYNRYSYCLNNPPQIHRPQRQLFYLCRLQCLRKHDKCRL